MSLKVAMPAVCCCHVQPLEHAWLLNGCDDAGCIESEGIDNLPVHKTGRKIRLSF